MDLMGLVFSFAGKTAEEIPLVFGITVRPSSTTMPSLDIPLRSPLDTCVPLQTTITCFVVLRAVSLFSGCTAQVHGLGRKALGVFNHGNHTFQVRRLGTCRLVDGY
jgi:hypothetical protein